MLRDGFPSRMSPILVSRLRVDCSLTMAWYSKDEATAYTTAVRAAMADGRAVEALDEYRGRAELCEGGRSGRGDGHGARGRNRLMAGVTPLTEQLAFTVLPTRKSQEAPRIHDPQSETILVLPGS